jgi:hypothetical protein
MSHTQPTNGGLNSASGEFNPVSFSGKPTFFSSKKQATQDDGNFKIERKKDESTPAVVPEKSVEQPKYVSRQAQPAQT